MPTIIALTASEDSAAIFKCLSLGIFCYLSKPLSFHELVNSLLKVPRLKCREQKSVAPSFFPFMKVPSSQFYVKPFDRRTPSTASLTIPSNSDKEDVKEKTPRKRSQSFSSGSDKNKECMKPNDSSSFGMETSNHLEEDKSQKNHY